MAVPDKALPPIPRGPRSPSARSQTSSTTLDNTISTTSSQPLDARRSRRARSSMSTAPTTPEPPEPKTLDPQAAPLAPLPDDSAPAQSNHRGFKFWKSQKPHVALTPAPEPRCSPAKSHVIPEPTLREHEPSTTPIQAPGGGKGKFLGKLKASLLPKWGASPSPAPVQPTPPDPTTTDLDKPQEPPTLPAITPISLFSESAIFHREGAAVMRKSATPARRSRTSRPRPLAVPSSYSRRSAPRSARRQQSGAPSWVTCATFDRRDHSNNPPAASMHSSDFWSSNESLPTLASRPPTPDASPTRSHFGHTSPVVEGYARNGTGASAPVPETVVPRQSTRKATAASIADLDPKPTRDTSRGVEDRRGREGSSYGDNPSRRNTRRSRSMQGRPRSRRSEGSARPGGHRSRSRTRRSGPRRTPRVSTTSRASSAQRSPRTNSRFADQSKRPGRSRRIRRFFGGFVGPSWRGVRNYYAGAKKITTAAFHSKGAGSPATNAASRTERAASPTAFVSTFATSPAPFVSPFAMRSPHTSAEYPLDHPPRTPLESPALSHLRISTSAGKRNLPGRKSRPVPPSPLAS